MTGLLGKFKLDPLILKGISPELLNDRWINWKRSLDHVLIATDVKDAKKFNYLMPYGGLELQKIYYAINKNADSSTTSYDDDIKSLDEYFKPKHHAVFARHRFWQLKQEH